MNELNRNEQTVREVIDVVVEAVHLQHLNKADIKFDTPLMKDGLNLDSIDILEIVVAVEHHFGVKVTDAETGKKYFGSAGSIAEFIQIQRGQS